MISVAEAKQRLLRLGEEAEARRLAKGPLGTLRGKAVLGGAIGAALLGMAAAGRMKRGTSTPGYSLNRRLRTPRRTQDVKKAVGGLSMGLVFQLLRPLLPHLANHAAAYFARVRASRAAAVNGRAGTR